MIDNLVGNALKYSPEGKKIIVQVKPDVNNVAISVQDFGIGIDKKYHKHIFDKFYRVYGNDEKTFSGLGIGLFVSSEIIKRHRGRIWIDSKKGEGSIFSFSLPLVKKPRR